MSDAAPNQLPDATSHQCQACGLLLKSARNLQHHRSVRHSTLSFIFSCKEYVVASQQNGYTCPLVNCFQQHHNRDGLQRHLRKHHGVKFLSTPSSNAGLGVFISEDLLDGSNVGE